MVLTSKHPSSQMWKPYLFFHGDVDGKGRIHWFFFISKKTLNYSPDIHRSFFIAISFMFVYFVILDNLVWIKLVCNFRNQLPRKTNIIKCAKKISKNQKLKFYHLMVCYWVFSCHGKHAWFIGNFFFMNSIRNGYFNGEEGVLKCYYIIN